MKKGQVTLFIIIGLILLITAAIVIYLVGFKEKPIEKKAITPVMPIAEADPVSAFVMMCLKKTTADGLDLIGAQGGYLVPGFTVNPYEPTEGQAVMLGRGGKAMPYWWHMKSPNTCQGGCDFESLRPKLYSGGIEDHIKDYIEQNIEKCITDFAVLREQGFTIKAKSRPDVDVSIRENDILLELDWKIKVEKAGTTQDLRNFATTADLNIKKIYELATEITNMEIEYTYLENTIKELLYGFARLDQNALPPTAEMTFESGSGTYWIKSDIQQKIKQMMASYIPILQVSGTRNFNYMAAPGGVRDPELYEIMYNRQFIIPLEGTYPKLEVRFYYLNWWKPYIDLNCNGELCQPDSVLNELKFIFPMQKYNFAYDISIPVMIEINNPTALGGKGYSFKFFLEANLRNNNAFTTDTKLAPEIKGIGLNKFCDLNQRTSGDIEIELVDFLTKNLVEDATLVYTCGETSCAIGGTTSEKFVSKFPRCINGLLSIKKQGYMPIYLPMTISETGEKLKLQMYPEKELKVITRKYLYTKNRDWELDTSKLYSTEPEEQLLITLMKQPEEYEGEFSAITDIKAGQASSIKLVPGKYKMSITGFSKKNVVIPKDKRCIDAEYFLFFEVSPKTCFYVPPEDMIFNAENPFPTTMIEVEFEITPGKLYSAKEILLTYFSIAIDKVAQENRKIEDLNEISKMKSYSQAKQNLLKPVLR